ncbi:MAG: SDR family NAD(P)-dependent oxidoreductase [Thermoleophilaceae bacterium]|nr:SDR family NAD(P)-dependent oxidoreductase [Thermoleophilaceae bacterium]
MRIDGQTALVTGASRGIGAAIAQALAEKGADVLAGVRSPGDYAGPGRAVRVDLSSRDENDACAAALPLPEIDILVNNAGQMTGGLLEEQDTGEIYSMFQANLVGLTHLTARVLPSMIERGSGKIVNNASISGYAFFPAASTYAASKAGVVAFTESLHRELAGTGVSTLHLVTPGVNTDMLDATEEVYGRHMDTAEWPKVEPGEWAARVVRAIERDDRVLGPGGRLGFAKLASRGPAQLVDAISRRMFTR